VKDEMAFLKYRREVVRTWPESPRKVVFLTAIESRISMIEQQAGTVSTITRHAQPAN
jgi:hypothetical protein